MAKSPATSPPPKGAEPAAPRRTRARFLPIATLLTAGLAVAVAVVPDRLQPPPNTHSLLMFDGVCNLCDGFVNFVADGDSAMKVRFGAQQKHMDLLERVGAPTDLSTLILIQGDKHYIYTDAVLRTFALMDWPFKALSAGYILPSPVRDTLYKLVAKYRCGCLVPVARQCRQGCCSCPSSVMWWSSGLRIPRCRPDWSQTGFLRRAGTSCSVRWRRAVCRLAISRDVSSSTTGAMKRWTSSRGSRVACELRGRRKDARRLWGGANR